MNKKTNIVDIEKGGQRKRYSFTVEEKKGCSPLALFIVLLIAANVVSGCNDGDKVRKALTDCKSPIAVGAESYERCEK